MDLPRRRRGRIRELESQLVEAQKLEALGLLAGAVAHDFNNVLSAIRGYAEMLARDTTGRSADHANEILRAADGASALTRQLLTFSRRDPPHAAPVELSAVVRDASAMLGRLLGDGIDFECETAPVVASVDTGRLQQVLLNLVVNARDAMPNGGVLRIVTRPVEHDGTPYALIAVEDTGEGIEQSVRERMFEPFFTTKPVGLGTGLGLSTVYGVVQQHGGFITVESAPGEGSTFCVYLPVTA
jgi:signal transduction histidine kinase